MCDYDILLLNRIGRLKRKNRGRICLRWNRFCWVGRGLRGLGNFVWKGNFEKRGRLRSCFFRIFDDGCLDVVRGFGRFFVWVGMGDGKGKGKGWIDLFFIFGGGFLGRGGR